MQTESIGSFQITGGFRSKMETDDLNRRLKQIQQILEAVTNRLKSLGSAALIESRVVSGRCGTSLIVAETRDAAAHLHAAESIGVQVIKNVSNAEQQFQVAQHLFNSTALLSEMTIPEDLMVQ